MNIQIDSDLLYGEKDLSSQVEANNAMIRNFDTFGDSDNNSKNKKITAISELQSPVRPASPKETVQAKTKENVKINHDPYSDHSFQG